MRYIHTSAGLLLAPRLHMSHKQMLSTAPETTRNLISAGFVTPRYSEQDSWRCVGESIGLRLCSAPTDVPYQLFVGITRPGWHDVLLFSDRRELLAKCTDVTEAHWKYSVEPTHSGDVPVFAPHHPSRSLSADALFGPW